MKTSVFLLKHFFFFSLLSLVACKTSHYVLNSDTIPVCSDEDLAKWSHIKNNMQGIAACDPVGHTIYWIPSEKGAFNDNWYPLAPTKQALCGELHEFNAYTPFWFPNLGHAEEMDWNNYIIPSDAYSFMITEALPYKKGDEWKNCGTPSYCIDGEITPDDSYFENPFFPKSLSTSWLEDRDICMYGPWVREENHDNRPEIHPSELIWWRDSLTGGNLFWMMFLQDDSDRYHSKARFGISGVVTGDWRPWAKPPMTAQLKIAFEVQSQLLDKPVRMVIGESDSKYVVTKEDPEASKDVSPGKKHTLEYNGKIVLEVEESQPNDNDLGVTFVDVCRRPNGTLQGYVQITTKIGKNNEGKEGYHILYAAMLDASSIVQPNPALPDIYKVSHIDPFSTKFRVDPGTLRLEAVDSQKQIFGNASIEIIATAAKMPKVKIKKAVLHEKGETKLLQLKKVGRNHFELLSIPLLSGSTIELETESGKSIIQSLHGMSVNTFVRRQLPKELEEAPAAWNSFLRLADTKPNAIPAPANFVSIGKQELHVSPGYFPLGADNRPEFGEENPVAEFLNQVIEQRDDRQIMSVFGSLSPFTIEWHFEAHELVSGKSIPITINSTVSGEAVNIRIDSISFANDLLELSFPDTKERDVFYQVLATATIVDAFGNRQTQSYELLSHALKIENNDEGLKRLMELAGSLTSGSSADFLHLSEFPERQETCNCLEDPKKRIAQSIRIAAMDFSQDGMVTLGELRMLANAANLFSRQ